MVDPGANINYVGYDWIKLLNGTIPLSVALLKVLVDKALTLMRVRS